MSVAIGIGVDAIANAIKDCFSNGGKVITFGCGGQAANAIHFAAELAGKFEEFEQPLPCIDICSNPSILTAITNDFGWEYVFSRQIKALGKSGDVVVAFSISGEGMYIVNALMTANEIGCKTVLINGKKDVTWGNFVDILYALDSEDTPKVQEWQLYVVHQLCWGVKGHG